MGGNNISTVIPLALDINIKEETLFIPFLTLVFPQTPLHTKDWQLPCCPYHRSKNWKNRCFYLFWVTVFKHLIVFPALARENILNNYFALNKGHVYSSVNWFRNWIILPFMATLEKKTKHTEHMEREISLKLQQTN